MLEITSFKAFDGDCIYFRYGIADFTNILIDIGRSRNFKSALVPLFENLSDNGEKIDLLIITHIDADHIGSISKVITSQYSNEVIKSVIFNTPYNKINDYSNDKISFKQGKTAFEFFNSHKISLKSVSNSENIKLNIKSGYFTFLSPNKDGIIDLFNNWEENDKISARKSDWNENFEVLFDNKISEDNSVTNCSSIAFLFQYENYNVIFLGDSIPSIVTGALKNLGYSKLNPIKVDLVKVSHHGSKHNISIEFLDIINCNKFLISGNGKYLYKETLVKIAILNLCNGIDKTYFYFNYERNCYKEFLSKEEMQKYQIECFFADDNKNGIVINFDN